MTEKKQTMKRKFPIRQMTILITIRRRILYEQMYPFFLKKSVPVDHLQL